MPDSHLGIDLLLPQRRRRRDAMVAVAHEVGIAKLDQLNRRQAAAAHIRSGDADPAILGVILQRVKRAVEILAAPLATVDLVDGHGLRTGGAAITDGAGGGNLREVEQLTRLAAQLGPDLSKPTGRQACA